jgi:hypothetical protein
MPILSKATSAVRKGFLKAATSRMNVSPKTAGVDNFRGFYYYHMQELFRNRFTWLLVASGNSSMKALAAFKIP